MADRSSDEMPSIEQCLEEVLGPEKVVDKAKLLHEMVPAKELKTIAGELELDDEGREWRPRGEVPTISPHGGLKRIRRAKTVPSRRKAVNRRLEQMARRHDEHRREVKFETISDTKRQAMVESELGDGEG